VPCPFCTPDPARILHHTDRTLALHDAYPLTPGHTLIVPRRHILSWFDATPDEQHALTDAIAAVRALIEEEHSPDGYNVGMNLGEAAGQTVFHLHIHVIPRYAGDADDPRGGIRWILPERAAYWKGGG